MKWFGLFVLQFVMFSSDAQSLKKYPIGNSGCSNYMFCDPGEVEMTYSQDSSKVYTVECEKDSNSYGIICVVLKESASDLIRAEELLMAYMDFLKSSFEIESSAGYGKGHRLRGNENTRGIIDYWQDKDKNNIKVKGWTNGKYVVVLYAASQVELAETKVNAFLDGLMLP